MAFLAVMNALSGCVSVPNSPAVCRVQFDYTDGAIEQLNVQNLRALAAYRHICLQKQ